VSPAGAEASIIGRWAGVREEQIVEGQLVIKNWGKGRHSGLLRLARGDFLSQLTALTGLSKKGGSIGTQI